MLTSRIVFIIITLAAAAGQAQEIAFGPNDVHSVFFIGKSDDGNQAHYGIRLDPSCAPVDNEAMFVYWLALDHPPVHTQPLSFLDHIPYGISLQKAVKRTASGGQQMVKLKQFGRPIVVETKREGDKCTAVARATINGKTAQLLSVFAKLKSKVSVYYIDVHGRDLVSGAPVDERIER